MARGPCTFRQRDLTAAIRAAEAAGKTAFAAEITQDGKIRIILAAGEVPEAGAKNPWDKED